MATRPSSLRSPRPQGESASPREPKLSVVSARELRRRRQLRQTRLLIGLAAAIVVSSLLVVAAAQAVVASDQARIDNVQQQLSSAVTANGNLELSRAELASPTRILQLAQHSLGMVTPASVVYLAPVKVGATVGSPGGNGKS